VLRFASSETFRTGAATRSDLEPAQASLRRPFRSGSHDGSSQGTSRSRDGDNNPRSPHTLQAYAITTAQANHARLPDRAPQSCGAPVPLSGFVYWFHMSQTRDKRRRVDLDLFVLALIDSGIPTQWRRRARRWKPLPQAAKWQVVTQTMTQTPCL